MDTFSVHTARYTMLTVTWCCSECCEPSGLNFEVLYKLAKQKSLWSQQYESWLNDLLKHTSKIVSQAIKTQPMRRLNTESNMHWCWLGLACVKDCWLHSQGGKLSGPAHMWAQFLTMHAGLLTCTLTLCKPDRFKSGRPVYNPLNSL